MPFRKSKSKHLDELTNIEYNTIVIVIPKKDIVVDGADAFLKAQEEAEKYFEEEALIAYFEKTHSGGCRVSFIRESDFDGKPTDIVLEKD